MASVTSDPYQVLGVPKDAQIPEIRSAHRKLILKCHPDKVQDATLKAQKQDEFQKVQRAYELLSDDNERQRYDEQAKLTELRRQMQNKANISSPRSSPRSPKYAEFEVRTAEPRVSPFNPGPPPMPNSKSYSYSRSWEDDIGQGPRIFEPARRPPRRESSYADKPSKREAERERERERDARDREKERDRERRRRSDRAERAEKEAKEARRAEKKVREKQREKEIRRETEEKRRHAKPFVESSYDDEPAPSRSERKKSSSSRKYDDTRERERSAHRDDIPPPAAVPPPPIGPSRHAAQMNYAASYIEASRGKKGPPGLQRSATYHAGRSDQPVPAAPTPPPIPGQASAFAAPDDDDPRRSQARPRRGSGDSPRLSRERSYRTSSREEVDPLVVNVSPSTRHPAQFSSSPPRRDLPRMHTMPPEQAYPRPMPGITRAQTFNAFDAGPDRRPRDRSRLQSQIDEESDSDDINERRAREARDRKYRSSRRTRSPEPMRAEHVSRYQVDGGRAIPNPSYSRKLEPDLQQYYTSTGNIRVVESRPPMPSRETAYSSSGGPGRFPKVKTSKSYSQDDIQYSNHFPRTHREEYMAYA